MDRENDPVIEAVVEALVAVIFGAEAGLEQVFVLITGGFGSLGKGFPALWGPAELILRDGFVFQTTRLKVLDRKSVV